MEIKNKSRILAIAMILTIAASIVMVTIPVQADTTYDNMQDGGSTTLPDGVTPDVTVETTAYLSFRPTTVGLGQTFLVNIWLTPATHVSRYLSDYTVTITKPDGTQDVITLDSYYADTTAWFEYTADQVGEWTIKFEFPGGYFPAGNYSVEAGAVIGSQVVSFSQSCYYEPSETIEQTLVVQEEQVTSWPEASLPTDYWTRPVSPENREWASILGNYPWYGPGDSDDWPEDTSIYWGPDQLFTPYVDAPDSAHIVWKRQGAIGGLIGGYYEDESWTSGGGNPTIIYSGRCYQTLTKVVDGTTQSVWQCYDLRTGEVYWERTGLGSQTPTLIEYFDGYSETPGAETEYGRATYLVYVGGGRLIRYDPYTGAVSYNISIAPLTTGTYYMNGYFLSVQDLGSSYSADERYRLINWTTTADAGYFLSITNFRMQVVSNITWPWSSLGTTQDFDAGIAAMTTAITPSAVGAYYGTIIQAADLTTGSLLWNITVEDTMYSSSCTVADHGKVAVLMMGGYYLAYDLTTGEQAWQSEAMDYPWSEPAFGAYSVQSAYGMIYREAYDGVYAFDWDDGSIVWKYTAPATSYETPYIDENGTSVYSFNAGGIIADGKLYVYNTEHTATQPITRGWKLHCIDAYTGEGLWNITGCMTPGAVADGYLSVSNSYDGYQYIFGKGQSATTIEAPLTAVTLGESLVIKGTVLDQSPAQAGTACVSQDSMASWMEYLHMQKSIPANITGVSVSIDVVDPNGNSYNIATVTSDGYSGTYGYTWEPEIAGQYTVTATFMGDDSYGSSFATTYVSVVESTETSPTPTTSISFDAINSTVTSTILGGVVAIIIAIAIVGVLVLRKR